MNTAEEGVAAVKVCDKTLDFFPGEESCSQPPDPKTEKLNAMRIRYEEEQLRLKEKYAKRFNKASVLSKPVSDRRKEALEKMDALRKLIREKLNPTMPESDVDRLIADAVTATLPSREVANEV